MITTKKEIYIAFYTPQPIWVINSLNLETFENIKAAAQEIDQIVYSKTYKNLKFKACRDGLFMMHIPEMEMIRPVGVLKSIDQLIIWWNKYLEFANSFFLLLDSSLLHYEKYAYFDLAGINKNDLWAASFEGDQLKGMGHAGHTQTASSESFSRRKLIQQFKEEFEKELEYRCPDSPYIADRYKAKVVDLVSRPLNMHHTISAKVLDHTVTALDELLQKNSSLVTLLAELAKAIAQFKIGDFEVALALSWFVIEKLLSDEWENFISSKNKTFPSGSQRISSERKEKLRGRDYPISVKLSTLELSEIIPFELFQKIDQIREYRNKVIHRNTKFVCLSSHSLEAIQTAQLLFSKKYDFSFEVNGSLSSMGLGGL